MSARTRTGSHHRAAVPATAPWSPSPSRSSWRWAAPGCPRRPRRPRRLRNSRAGRTCSRPGGRSRQSGRARPGSRRSGRPTTLRAEAAASGMGTVRPPPASRRRAPAGTPGTTAPTTSRAVRANAATPVPRPAAGRLQSHRPRDRGPVPGPRLMARRPDRSLRATTPPGWTTRAPTAAGRMTGAHPVPEASRTVHPRRVRRAAGAPPAAEAAAVGPVAVTAARAEHPAPVVTDTAVRPAPTPAAHRAAAQATGFPGSGVPPPGGSAPRVRARVRCGSRDQCCWRAREFPRPSYCRPPRRPHWRPGEAPPWPVHPSPAPVGRSVRRPSSHSSCS